MAADAAPTRGGRHVGDRGGARRRTCAPAAAYRPGRQDRWHHGRHRRGASPARAHAGATRRGARVHCRLQVVRWHAAAAAAAMSIVALARRTLFYEWRKFLPAALAVAFSGLLLLMQAALMFGIFNSASVYVSKSDAD